MTVGQLIKHIRVSKGVSQKDMAKKFGISQNYLSLIESNKKTPSNETLTEFARHLNISKDAFVFAISDVPSELPEEGKRNFSRLQENIIQLLLFDLKKGVSSNE